MSFGFFSRMGRYNLAHSMAERINVVIGNSSADHVSIAVSRSGHEGWSAAEIEVRCDGWFGRFRGEFMRGELSRFGKEVSRLHKELTGTAKLDPSEPNVTLTGDGKGHITVDGKARQHFETDTFLKFRFLIDQTYLKELYERLLAADPD